MNQSLWILVAYRNTAGIREFLDRELALDGARGWSLGIHFNQVGVRERGALEAEVRSSGWNLHTTSSDQNTGYLTGASLCLQHARRSESIGRVVLSNFDLKTRKGDLLVQVARVPATIGCPIWGPRVITDQRGHDQSPLMKNRPSARRMRVLSRVFRTRLGTTAWALGSAIRSTMRPREAAVSTGRGREQVYAPHGSLLVLEHSFFDNGGTLDYGGRLYGEEVYLAEQVRGMGQACAVDFNLEVVHEEHAVTGKWPSKETARLRAISSRFLAREYFSSGRRVQDSV